MVDLGIIASRSEILPAKKKRTKKNKEGEEMASDDANNSSDDTDNSSSSESDAVPRRQSTTTKKKSGGVQKARSKKQSASSQLDLNKLREQIVSLGEDFKSVLSWLEESLNDAAEDVEEDSSTDPDDCVPLVPFSSEQRAAMETSEFKALLIGLGMQEPIEMEVYWRIPNNFTATDIKLRAQIVSGTMENIEDQSYLNNIVVEENYADQSDADDRSVASSRVNTLIYNESDDEVSAPHVDTTTKQAANKKPKGKKKFDIFDMIKATEDSQDTFYDSDSEIQESLMIASDDEDSSDKSQVIENRPRGNTILDSDDDDDNQNTPHVSLHVDSENIGVVSNDAELNEIGGTSGKKRERSGSDGSDSDGPEIGAKIVKRKRAAIIEDDDDE